MIAHDVQYRHSKRVAWGALLLSFPAVLFVLVLFVYPFIFGLNLSLQNVDGSGPTLANYIHFFGDGSELDTIRITFVVSLPVTLFSIAVSIPLAYFMRHGIKFERLITICLILPMALGTVMVAQAMQAYFGPVGWVNQIMRLLFHLSAPLPLLHNWLGVEIALFLLGFPFVFLMIVGYMSAISPDLERASRMLGASSWHTFWHVIFPLSLPGIAIAFCLNFVANFGVFPTAELVGDPSGTTRVLSIAAYDAYSTPNYPQATTIALVMGVLELLVIGFVLVLRNRLTRTVVISGGKGA